MTKASDNEFPSVLFDEQPSDPSTPATGFWRAFFKSDGMYVIDDAGTVTGPFGAGGSGNVATDAIWDAKGDLAAATGANAAARLAVGGNGSFLQAASGETTGLKWNAAPVGAAYKRTSGDYTTSSTTMTTVDNTNMNFTVTTLARRVRVGFVGTCYHSTTSNINFDVEIDGTLQGAPVSAGFGGLVTVRPNVGSREANGSFVYLTDVLTAASHTFKLMWSTAGATATLKGATGPSAYSQFWIEETFLTT